MTEPTRFAINGFGRVGRCVARASLSGARPELVLAAVNAPSGPELAAHLLKYDSVHGVFPGEVRAGKDCVVVGERKIPCASERDADKLDWESFGADIVMECAGKFKTRDAAAVHLRRGAKKVLVSAPMADADATVVYGVNHRVLSESDDLQIVSNGSCTTNCAAPVLEVLRTVAGIEFVSLTTVHAQTADQNLIDGSHRDLRRSRAAGASLIPAATGAADNIARVIPELAGRVSAVAVRAPVLNVSLADFACQLSRPTDADEINAAFRAAASVPVADGGMEGVLSASEVPLVSVDFNGRPESAVVDASQTRALGGRFVKLMAWYDNEWAFATRMLDVAALLS